MENKKAERVKRDAENLAESSKEMFVDYVNNLAEKAEDFTEKQLEKLEKALEK